MPRASSGHDIDDWDDKIWDFWTDGISVGFWSYNGLKLLENLGWGECIFHEGWMWILGATEWTVVGRNLVPMISDPGVNPMVILAHGKRDFAGVIKIANQLTLKHNKHPSCIIQVDTVWSQESLKAKEEGREIQNMRRTQITITGLKIEWIT